MSGFFTTIRNRKKPVNILIEMVNVGKIYSRNSKCLFFLLQSEIVKKTVYILIEIVNVGEFYSGSRKCRKHVHQVLGNIKG